jgi:hypothetical protein
MAKAQGISINVIVVAAIALLVLVVLSVMFVGKIGLFAGKSSSCSEQGGSCQIDQCSTGLKEYSAWTCPKTAEGADQKCCIPGA